MCISIFCNACDYDAFVEIIVTNYWINIYNFVITLITLNKIITYALETPLDITTICHYKKTKLNMFFNTFDLFLLIFW
jgi:hypothetical protein